MAPALEPDSPADEELPLEREPIEPMSGHGCFVGDAGLLGAADFWAGAEVGGVVGVEVVGAAAAPAMPAAAPPVASAPVIIVALSMLEMDMFMGSNLLVDG